MDTQVDTTQPEPPLHEIDDTIATLQFSLSLFPRSHPRYRTCIQTLAMVHFVRSKVLCQKEDLDKSISYYTKAIFLAHQSADAPSLNILQNVFYLAFTLLHRSQTFKRPEDAKYSVEYFRYLRNQPLVAFNIPPDQVTAWLVQALGIQVVLGSSNVARDVEEMTTLCRGLLASDSSVAYSTSAIEALASAALISLRTERQPLNGAIECLRQATRRPGLQGASYLLAMCLFIRFIMTYSNEDCDEAIAAFEQTISSHATPDSLHALATPLLTMLTNFRSVVYKNPAYLEEAICHFRRFLGSATLGGPLRTFLTETLWGNAQRRFEYFGVTPGLEEMRSRGPEIVNPSSFPCMGVDLTEWFSALFPDALAGEAADNMQHLENVVSTMHNDQKMDIDRVVETSRVIFDSLRSSNPFGFSHTVLFSEVLLCAFQRTNAVEHLNESITLRREVLNIPSARKVQYHVTRLLIFSLVARWRLFRRKEDSDEINTKLFPMAVNSIHASLPDRFQSSCLWAGIARRFGHPSVAAAYENAMSLMQSSLVFAPTLQIQHARLVSMRESCEKVTLDYASYLIDTGRVKQAIETLEQGRASLWSEMRGLRIFVVSDSPLAEKFAAVNRDLEELTMSIAPGGNPISCQAEVENLEGMDSFGLLVVKYRRLLEERDTLVSQIQAFPGFGDFLKVPPFDTLCLAASRGPVIVINHSKWRSDIVVLLHRSPPSLIVTPDDFYDRANGLKDKLLGARNKYGLDSAQYDLTLASVLADLYKLVGNPVIDRLQELNIPEQSRIWWCPTSVFCSLPLHAMGPIPSDDSRGDKRYSMDLYISSYTPTLSALIQSRECNPVSQSFDRPSLLLVAQPDPSLPEVGGEIEVIQTLNMQVTSLISENATAGAVVDHLRNHRFVHFACHGTLESGKPFDAAFELHGDERLTLLEIVRSRLPTAEFAFLSACHTAELTEESIADEVLHLAAAVQYCGFRSVVGTMWAMVDEDGRDSAKHFYKSMFSGRESTAPYYERSAKALRDAVRKLRRKKRISLERWVNFVHYGA
ncbi:CHAT domain-containing protein [Lactarius deliciosus]|nr:CHAT domain-containing protein [Lactarius deliciosus]